MPKQSLWVTRDAALEELGSALLSEAAVLDEIFRLLDEAIENLEKFYVNDSDVARVSAVVAVKGRNLALGCYSLALDGLAQESGALLRPLVEVIELLIYLRIVPEGTQQAIDGKLPTAGQRARRISGSLKELRDSLSQNACHIDLSYESMKHVVDLSIGRLRVVQPHRPEVLRTNMGSISAFTSMLARETARLFALCSAECSQSSRKADVTAEALLGKIALVSNKARALFYPEVLTGGRAMVDLPSSTQ
jgi:hypothetical protein